MGKPIRKIACCCGAGVASSMTAKYEIEDYLADHGVTDVEIICYRIEDFDDFVQNVQMVISATKLVKDTDADKESLTKQTAAVVAVTVVLGIIISIIDLAIKFGFDKLLQLG